MLTCISTGKGNYSRVTPLDAKWSFIKSKILTAVESNIPKRKTSSKHTGLATAPLNQKVLAKIRKKHRAWQRFMETREGEKYNDYCRLRNQVKSLTRKAKRDHERDIANKSKDNPKKFWQYVKSQTKTRPGVSDLKYKDADTNQEKTTETDKEKAEVLLNFFSTVFTIEPDGDLPQFGSRADTMMAGIKVDVDIVKKKLDKLNSNKSPGPDGIHPRVLKEASESLSLPLSLLFQHSLDTGEVPEDWRRAHVSAIFKKGCKKQPGNYRPVSLTCITCKILESIIRDAVFEHMTSNHLFSDYQFGFIKGRSTSLQLLKVLDEWTEALDDRGSVDAVYLDFQKAFDKVPHARLLQKLQNYGVPAQLCSWTRGFLSNRRHKVVVNGASSEWAEVTSGIPQGSVLGPLLFVIYINDLPDALSSRAYLFADDTKIFRKIDVPEDEELLQRDLNQLTRWSDTWLLKFHPQKCKVLEITMSHDKRKHDYTLDDISLEHTDMEKDIGVIVDSKLSFSQHMAEKINSANRVVGVIRRSFTHLNDQVFLKLYKALVRPILEYANVVWAPYYKKDIVAI
jgi:hypothetical protein